MLIGAVSKRYVSPAILYGSEELCLKESEMGIYYGQRYPWCEQCVVCSSTVDTKLRT